LRLPRAPIPAARSDRLSTIHELGAFLARETTSASASGAVPGAVPAVEAPIAASGSNGGPATTHG
jgi:hypothetical protein